MTKRSGSKQAPDLDTPLFAPLSETKAGPSPIDVHVGNRIRLRRTLAGLSQEKLGDALGLTFQQVQKYERGANRVSASRLFDLSRVLDVPVSFFYDDMPVPGQNGGGSTFSSSAGPAHGGAQGSALGNAKGGGRGGFAETRDGFGGGTTPDDVFSRKETIDLVRAYYRIAEPPKRRKVLDLIKSMAPD